MAHERTDFDTEPRSISYVRIPSYWRTLRKYAESEEATAIWRPGMLQWWSLNMLDFNDATGDWPVEDLHTIAVYPADYDNVDWRPFNEDGSNRIGRRPEFWKYVCMGACYFLVNLNLHLAKKWRPQIPWRVLSSEYHATVWNGDRENMILFDMQYLALGVQLPRAWEVLCHPNYRPKVGEPGEPYQYKTNFSKEVQARLQEEARRQQRRIQRAERRLELAPAT